MLLQSQTESCDHGIAVTPECASRCEHSMHLHTIEREDVSWFGVCGAPHDSHVPCLKSVRPPDHWLVSADHIGVCNMRVRIWSAALLALWALKVNLLCNFHTYICVTACSQCPVCA